MKKLNNFLLKLKNGSIKELFNYELKENNWTNQNKTIQELFILLKKERKTLNKIFILKILLNCFNKQDKIYNPKTNLDMKTIIEKLQKELKKIKNSKHTIIKLNLYIIMYQLIEQKMLDLDIEGKFFLNFNNEFIKILVDNYHLLTEDEESIALSILSQKLIFNPIISLDDYKLFLLIIKSEFIKYEFKIYLFKIIEKKEINKNILKEFY